MVACYLGETGTYGVSKSMFLVREKIQIRLLGTNIYQNRFILQQTIATLTPKTEVDFLTKVDIVLL